MRRLLVSIATLAAVAGMLGGFANPAEARKDLSDIIVCVTEPCP